MADRIPGPVKEPGTVADPDGSTAQRRSDGPGEGDINALLDDLTAEGAGAPIEAPAKPRRSLSQMLRKIPVTLTLEVGSAEVTLDQLMGLEHGSVVELDALAGAPLIIKVNGTAIGRAEVVVTGENYGLKVLELTDLDLLSLDAQR